MLQLETVARFDQGGHHLRVVRPQEEEAFLAELAQEYLSLRTATASELGEISVEGIGVVSVEALRGRLKAARVPARGRGTSHLTATRVPRHRSEAGAEHAVVNTLMDEIIDLLTNQSASEVFGCAQARVELSGQGEH